MVHSKKVALSVQLRTFHSIQLVNNYGKYSTPTGFCYNPICEILDGQDNINTIYVGKTLHKNIHSEQPVVYICCLMFGIVCARHSGMVYDDA